MRVESITESVGECAAERRRGYVLYLARWVRKTAIMMTGMVTIMTPSTMTMASGPRPTTLQTLLSLEQMQQPIEQHRVSRL